MLKKIVVLFMISTFAGALYSSEEESLIKENAKKIEELQKQLDKLKKTQSNEIQGSTSQHFNNVRFSGDVSVFAFSEQNPVYNAGRASDWQELIAHFKTTIDLDGGHEANLRIAALSTSGDDIDSYGPRTDDDTVVADEINVYLKDIFTEGLNVRVGRQSFKLGDGWLMADGYVDSITRFNGSLHYFDGIDAVYKLDEKAELQGYWLRLTNDYVQFDESITPFVGGGSILGAEARYKSEILGNWAIGGMRRHDKSRLKNETILSYIRVDKNFTKDLQFHMEYAMQSGRTGMRTGVVDPIESNSHRRKAWAANVSLKQSFSSVKYKPWLKLNYIQYSGDKQSTSQNETWDPLFYHWLSYGTGAVNNSNLIVQRAIAGCSVTDRLMLQVEWRDYYWDRLRPGFTERHYADLLGITGNYLVSKDVFMGGTVGWLDPHQAATNYFGPNNDRTIRIVGAWVATKF